MERKETVTSANVAERISVGERGKTVAAPLFDEHAVRRARPAVPRAGVTRWKLPWPLVVVLMVAGAGLLGGIIGGVVTGLYQDRPRVLARAPEQKPASPISELGGGDRAELPAAAPVAPAQDVRVAQEATVDSIEGNKRGVKKGETRERQPALASAPEASTLPDATQSNLPVDNEVSGAKEAQDVLRGALGEWIAATNARDVDRQMNFYDQKVNAFYLTRNVSRAAVRAEKARVIGSADAVDVRADAPVIKLSPDGRTATMRFRKRYAIAGRKGDRRGEVLQELRWRRAGDGWKIVSERDLRVIN